MFSIKRIKQVFQFGWMHAGEISRKYFSGKKRVSLFIDILSCFVKYGMWSNQYVKEQFWALSPNEKESIGAKYQRANSKKEQWLRDFYENRDFFIKYGNVKFEKSLLREKRNKAYSEKYNAGKNLMVEYDVNISRQHYLDGTISIGDNVLLAKHVFIDYSGQVVLRDGVKISNGVIIESHSHYINKTDGSAVPGHLVIDDHVKIYTRAYIADTCHHIGRHARIGAGCYVRNNIPPYAIVMGNPAKIVGFVSTPQETVEFEKENYPESERIPFEALEHNYNKYFKNRINEIKEFIKQ